MNFTHCVKVDGRIVYAGFAEEAREEALRLNLKYQTDEYRVEVYEPERWS